MAGKKDQQKSFHNPFKQLKGLSVSDAPQPPQKPPRAKETPPPAPAREPDDDALFAEEMARLGLDAPPPPPATEEPSRDEEAPPEDAPEAPPASDEDLFLDALQGMDTVFRDELPFPEAAPPQPSRMKLLRRGRLHPEARLDLHGLTRAEALTRVNYFLDNAVYQGQKIVLIITGRGKSSGEEPVLRAAIERYLAHDAGAWVSEWGRAPRHYGGEGALVVFLKGRT